MIALLTGEVAQKSASSVVINVNGVGYHVNVPLSTYSKLPDIGKEVRLYIHTHVREDQISLFGFASPENREMFLRLIGINGIGPKLGLSILSGIDIKELENAISCGEAARLQLIPGVGKKTAERIIIELKDKIHIKFEGLACGSQNLYEDALSALVNLGYARQQASLALNRIPKKDNLTLEVLIKLAFKELQ